MDASTSPLHEITQHEMFTTILIHAFSLTEDYKHHSKPMPTLQLHPWVHPKK
jgi:hypothetical protein